ncbi:hypothetical protein [Sideroxydans sp.]
MRTNMLVREAIASILASALFFAPFLLALFVPTEADPNDSWQRGVVVAPLIFAISVPIIWGSGGYLLSKGLRTPFRFSFGAFALAGGLVAVLVTPAIVIGSIVGLFSWTSATLGGLAVTLCASVASIPASLAWWWVAAHNKSFNRDAQQQASPAVGAR